VTIYVAVGSILEERKMALAFGPEYEGYRKAVPWLIPFVKPRR
jgi:protein-S-isoprenylcysteine O-methyltransferase Ste14